ncbi:MAG TPA: hypothetical protein PLP29_05495 [Candidatus Ozemobacteraceae bacterium]|nr:hypothetical protein [Candidatus Ozemobacteraceae bacterium]
MKRHEIDGEATESCSPAVKALLEHAGALLRWCETTLEAIRAHRNQFGDLDVAGLEVGITFLRRRLIPHVKTGGRLPPVVILCGGTNTGKSTLINTISECIVSPSGSTASFTKRLVGAGREEDLKAITAAHADFHLVPTSELSAHRPRRRAIYADHRPDWPVGLPVLLDSPDVDSSDPACRAAARLGLGLADLLVWVTTQQKYKDLAGISFLDEAMLLLPRRIDVFNQYLPRHQEALEDLTTSYGERWPDHRRAVLAIPEQSPAGEGRLPVSAVAELRRHLVEAAADARGRRIEALSHGLAGAGNALAGSAGMILSRQDECAGMIREYRLRFEAGLQQPLRDLPGHEAPFELQNAVIRVLQPRLKTSVGDLVTSITRTAGNALRKGVSLFGIGSMLGAQAPGDPVDPVSERDRRDIEATARLLESARADLLDRSRVASEQGRAVAARFHEELRQLAWPEPEALRERLREHFDAGRMERIRPVIDRFEHDLEAFCDRNPEMIQTMRAMVPGLSALAGLAAAVIAIKTTVILPGVTEYLLGGIGLPIYKRFEEWLPGNLLGLVDQLSREPFIARTYDAFSKTRRAVFLETTEWLSKPVEALLLPVDLERRDVPLLLEQLRTDWDAVRAEW